MGDNNLTILAQGVLVRGNVFSEDVLVVEGNVKGNLFGNKIVIKATGRVQGDLNCRSLSIESGGVLNGFMKVSSELTALAYEVDEPKGLPEPRPEPEVSLDLGLLYDQGLEQGELPIEQAEAARLEDEESPLEMDIAQELPGMENPGTPPEDPEKAPDDPAPGSTRSQ